MCKPFLLQRQITATKLDTSSLEKSSLAFLFTTHTPVTELMNCGLHWLCIEGHVSRFSWLLAL
jgi:hypothetical protein